MRLLLDAGALLGVAFGTPKLSAALKAALSDRGNEVWVSAISPYELEWKRQIGKLAFPDVADWAAEVSAKGFLVAPLTVAHSIAAARLPHHHRDPWDRLIVGQALVEGLTVVTGDRVVPRYGVPVLW